MDEREVITKSEFNVEWAYIRDERLGMICEDREPTDAEAEQALRETAEHMALFKVIDDPE